MTIPYWTVAYLLGPEFPSIVGGLIGLSIVVPAARWGWFMPADDALWDFEDRDQWEPEWTGIELHRAEHRGRDLGIVIAWAPYLLVALLLVLTRLESLPLQAWTSARAISWQNILGTATISHTVKPLYLPGTVFILVSLTTLLLHRMDIEAYGLAWKRSLKTTLIASTALVFTVPMVQVFVESGGGDAGYPKMPIALAAGVERLVGEAWPVFATFIGGIGAAVAGSNTVSNMMFSLFQFEVGSRIGVDPTWIVALQAVGGAAGNTICVHNVVAASAVVGLVGREGSVIRKTLLVFTYYALLAGALGYAIVWWSRKGPLNLGTFLLVLLAALGAAVIVTGRLSGRRAMDEAGY
jgi:lactate permease